MKRILKFLALAILMLPFSGCFRKKAAANNLQSWLDQHYPGQYKVLSTGPDDAIRHLSFKVKKSLVAQKANELIQVQLIWDKREANLGLTIAMVDEAFVQAASSYDAAQELYGILEKKGFGNMALGMKNGTVIVLIFEEPAKEKRQNMMMPLEQAFEEWAHTDKYAKEILLMDLSAMADISGDILPLSYFLEGNGQYEKQVLYRLRWPYGASLDNNEQDVWHYNPLNDKFALVHEKVKTELDAWIKEHVKEPFYLIDLTEYEEISQQPLQYRFKFPFTNQDHTKAVSNNTYIEQDGYFLVDFDLDKNSATKFEIVHEQK